MGGLAQITTHVLASEAPKAPPFPKRRGSRVPAGTPFPTGPHPIPGRPELVPLSRPPFRIRTPYASSPIPTLTPSPPVRRPRPCSPALPSATDEASPPAASDQQDKAAVTAA